MKGDRFKASAWGVSKGQRVFNQMEGTGISGEYEVGEDHAGHSYRTIEITFDRARSRDAVPARALKTWVEALVSAHDDDGFALFSRLDMRMFAGDATTRQLRAPRKVSTASPKRLAKRRWDRRRSQRLRSGRASSR